MGHAWRAFRGFQNLVVLLGAVRYPIPICYLEGYPISGPQRCNCRRHHELTNLFCLFFHSKLRVKLKVRVTHTDKNRHTQKLYALHRLWAETFILVLYIYSKPEECSKEPIPASACQNSPYPQQKFWRPLAVLNSPLLFCFQHSKCQLKADMNS